jgi:hypothetical protein
MSKLIKFAEFDNKATFAFHKTEQNFSKFAEFDNKATFGFLKNEQIN